MKILISEKQYQKLLESDLTDDNIGKKVMVYYNLHKHTFSVTYKGVVILHAG